MCFRERYAVFCFVLFCLEKMIESALQWWSEGIWKMMFPQVVLYPCPLDAACLQSSTEVQHTAVIHPAPQWAPSPTQIFWKKFFIENRKVGHLQWASVLEMNVGGRGRRKRRMYTQMLSMYLISQMNVSITHYKHINKNIFFLKKSLSWKC